MEEGQRKRRKWDVAAPAGAAPAVPAGLPSAVPSQAAQPVDEDFFKRAKMVAAAIANRISEANAARGLASGAPSTAYESRQEIAREVFINDAPPPIRYNLTKKPIQDDIAARTKTVIVTKGRYYARGATVDENEKALHLRVTPGIHAGPTEEDRRQAVDAAAAEIQAIMQGERPNRPAPSSYNQQPPPGAYPSGSHSAPAASPAPEAASSCQLFIGINAPPEFGLAARLRGPGDQFIRHIAGSGAYVVLRGAGSGMVETPEPLHFSISGPTQRQVDAAKGLAQDLVTTVKKDLDRLFPAPPAGGAPASAPMAAYPPPAAHYPPAYPVAYPPPGGAAYPPQGAAYPPPGGMAYPSAAAYSSYPPPYQHAPPPGQYAGPQGAAPRPNSQPEAATTAAPQAMYHAPPTASYPPPSYPYAHPAYPPPMQGQGYPPPVGAQYGHHPASTPYAPQQYMAYANGAHPQSQQLAPPPGSYAAPPPPAASEPPPPLPSSPPRRRFRESKEDQPQVAGSNGGAGAQRLPGGYAQSYPQLAAPPAGSPPRQLNTSSPPLAGSMGPPPPRTVMGPPPPKFPSSTSAKAGGSEDADDAGAPTLKLVDYEGED